MDVAETFASLMSPEGRVDPYPTYERLRAYGPVVQVGPGTYAVTGHAEAAELLRDPHVRVLEGDVRDAVMPDWRNSPALSSIARSMLRTNAPDHGRMRRLAAGAFTPRRIADLREVVAAEADLLIDAMAAASRDGTPVDFMAEFAYPLPLRVICELLGVPAVDRPLFRRWAADLTGVLEPEITEAELAVADAGATELRGYFTELVAARRREPGDDLITALVQAHDAGERLSGEELLSNLVILLVAGFETTTNLLGNGLTVLLAHPQAADALRRYPEHAPAYVDELLRYDSPVQLTTRASGAALVVGGIQLPAGSWIVLLLGAANRDPRRYPHPERFDPWRAQLNPLAFGAGPHYCLGAGLARLEAQIAFVTLLRRLPELAAAGMPRRRDRLTLRGYDNLPVALGALAPATDRDAPAGTAPGTP
ncbi:Cytochrome P450 [Micromonospora phaseoli]|uniref:Cytochrome P450 n=1 Tax=Micromonospora phaseoli TaxID=1144548 RepID=A0A1H6T1X1_9ACTN|nr:cytochrome P450 [Micromonospora phaseoli]PZW04129.1 cytochrome P450 [Micromonospora phaseoli]GIJ79314.1 cytochrome P450 [Micromonospora phaseoli]SEI72114.1 Cytochrome P450 [Micromonospora phaseoli]